MKNQVEIKESVYDLIYLASCSVNGEKPDTGKCKEMDLPEIFDLSVRHSLVTVCAHSLEQVMTLPPYFLEEKYKTIRILSLYDIERAGIFEDFENEGIRYLPLKGIVLKGLYPKSYMRQMSDNDILCENSRMADVRDIMVKHGFSVTYYGKFNHDVYEKEPTLAFEMHRELYCDRIRSKEYSYRRDFLEKCEKDREDGFRCHMTDEDLYVFLIYHTYKHYRIMGTGLRSLLDIYVFNKVKKELDHDYLDKELDNLGLSAFEAGVRNLSEKVFTGMSLSESEQAELLFFVNSNTHGTYENIMTADLGNDDSKKAKLKYIRKRVFPDPESMKHGHPLVYRYKVLYPFWIVARPVKGLVANRKYMLSEFRRLKRFKKKDNTGKYT